MNELFRPAETAPHALLRGRRSVRRYQLRQPSRAALRRMFESAGAAPSAHNRQPWRFLTIAEADLKVRLAQAMGARLAADRRRDGDPEPAIQADVERSYRRITGAPIVIVVAMTLADMDRYPDGRRAHAERLMAVQSTAMAGQNLLLAAAAEGLGACWMCAPLFCETAVTAALSLPDDWEVQGLITLGDADRWRLSPLKPRRPVAQFAFLAGRDGERTPL